MHPFTRVTPTIDQQATMAGLGKAFASLYEDIVANLPESPYRAEALKYLEMASMFSSKGITHA